METTRSSAFASATSVRPIVDQPLLALAWMGASALGFSVMAVYLKRLTVELPQFELVFFRSAINLSWVLALMLIRRERLWVTSGKRLLIFRGVAGFAGVACMVYSISHLPLQMATMLNWCSPLFVILISRVVLGERMPPWSGVFLPIAFGGLALLLFPPGLADRLGLPEALHEAVSIKAAVVGIGAGAFGGLAYVAVRAATARVGANAIVLYFTAISTLIAAPLAAMNFVWPSSWQWLEVFALGSSATWGQLTMTRAYRYAPAGVVSVMNLLNPVFGAALGIGLFHETVGALQWVGILFVGIAVFGLAESSRRNIAIRNAVRHKDS